MVDQFFIECRSKLKPSFEYAMHARTIRYHATRFYLKLPYGATNLYPFDLNRYFGFPEIMRMFCAGMSMTISLVLSGQADALRERIIGAGPTPDSRPRNLPSGRMKKILTMQTADLVKRNYTG
jgi:hypothetical protein